MVKVRSSFFSIAFQFFSALLIVALLLTSIGVFIPAKWDETITAYQTKEEVKNSFGYTYAVSAIRFIEDEENVNIEKIEKISYTHKDWRGFTFMALNVLLDNGKTKSFYIKFYKRLIYNDYPPGSAHYQEEPTMITNVDFGNEVTPFLLEKLKVYTYDEYSLSVISEATIGGSVQWD